MNRQQHHHRRAEEILERLERLDDEHRGTQDEANEIALAQVHATLALFDPLREIGDQLDRRPRGWLAAYCAQPQPVPPHLVCTQPANHGGAHIARGEPDGPELARWSA